MSGIKSIMSLLKPSTVTLSQIKLENSKFNPTYVPVGIFLGGTSGVGEGMVKKLIDQTKGRAHVIILGRNSKKAEEMISSFQKHEEGKFEFLKCDVEDLKELRRVTRELKGRLKKINFLVLSTGILSLKGFTPTKDGLDKKLQLHYFARFRFMVDLIDLVQEAGKEGEKAQVISILDGSGKLVRLDENDLSLEKNYSVSNAAATAITYNDIMINEIVDRYPKVVAFHLLPGFVWTPLVQSFGPIVSSLGLILKPLSRSINEAAEWMWYRPWSEEKEWNKGAWNLDDKSRIGERNQFLDDERIRKLVWDFSLKVTEAKEENDS